MSCVSRIRLRRKGVNRTAGLPTFCTQDCTVASTISPCAVLSSLMAPPSRVRGAPLLNGKAAEELVSKTFGQFALPMAGRAQGSPEPLSLRLSTSGGRAHCRRSAWHRASANDDHREGLIPVYMLGPRPAALGARGADCLCRLPAERTLPRMPAAGIGKERRSDRAHAVAAKFSSLTSRLTT